MNQISDVLWSQHDFKQIEHINKFLAPGGLRHLMFYYQDVEVMDTGKAI